MLSVFFDFIFADIQVYFTPHQKCLPVVLRQIDNAQDSIFLQCYSFTSKPIAKKLLEAHKRGLKITIISDKSQLTAKSSVIPFLASKGIPIYIDHKVAIAHCKVIIFDKKKVITGSYNFTDAAENRNAENMIVVDDKNVAQQYFNNWVSRQKSSYVYEISNQRPNGAKEKIADYIQQLKKIIKKKKY